MNDNTKKPEISILLPCLNEEDSIGLCLNNITDVISKNSLSAEVIVIDNGSTDSSHKIAESKDVRVVNEAEPGYGAAYLKGFQESRGKYIFLADPDGSYDFNEIPRFMAQLKAGYDLVIGNRFSGNIEPGAMPLLRRYFGNPILSGVLRLFFRTKISDSQCGMRALSKKILRVLNLRATGMEFASEMVIKALKNRVSIKELPINYYKRYGKSKLKSFADGWRHLRFMLLYCPLFLFFIPGLILFMFGIVSLILLYFDLVNIFGIKFQYHPMFLSAIFVIIGYQLIIFALFAKTYSITHLGDAPIFESLYKFVTIEKASIIGIILGIFGMVIYIKIFLSWIINGFGELNEIRNAIFAMTITALGMQTIFSSFMLSILGIKEK